MNKNSPASCAWNSMNRFAHSHRMSFMKACQHRKALKGCLPKRIKWVSGGFWVCNFSHWLRPDPSSPALKYPPSPLSQHPTAMTSDGQELSITSSAPKRTLEADGSDSEGQSFSLYFRIRKIASLPFLVHQTMRSVMVSFCTSHLRGVCYIPSMMPHIRITSRHCAFIAAFFGLLHSIPDLGIA
jgi:hypothetical protein